MGLRQTWSKAQGQLEALFDQQYDLSSHQVSGSFESQLSSHSAFETLSHHKNPSWLRASLFQSLVPSFETGVALVSHDDQWEGLFGFHLGLWYSFEKEPFQLPFTPPPLSLHSWKTCKNQKVIQSLVQSKVLLDPSHDVLLWKPFDDVLYLLTSKWSPLVLKPFLQDLNSALIQSQKLTHE